MKKWIFLFFYMLLIFSLNAESRLYRCNTPINEAISKFVDKLSQSKIKFQIRRSYNETTDGRLGFSAYMIPGKSIVDIQFFDDNNKRTITKLFYENEWDGKLFNDILIKIYCQEEANNKFDDSLPPNWPQIH